MTYVSISYIPGDEVESAMLPGGMDVYVHDASEWWSGQGYYSFLWLTISKQLQSFRESDDVLSRRALFRGEWKAGLCEIR